MIKRKLYLYIQNDGYIKCYNKKGICKEIPTLNAGSIKNKKLVIIFETQDVLIKEITFPKVNKSLEYNVINNEIAYEIGKSDDIIFDYNVYRYSDKETDAIVYCLRYYSDKIIRNLSKNNLIVAMYNLPMLILSYIKVSIQEYLVFYKSSNRIYIMACFNDHLVCFHGFGYFNKNDLNKNFMLFISEFLDEKYKKCLKTVYFINFDISEIIEAQKEGCRYYDIGKISADEIINKMNSGGKYEAF